MGGFIPGEFDSTNTQTDTGEPANAVQPAIDRQAAYQLASSQLQAFHQQQAASELGNMQLSQQHYPYMGLQSLTSLYGTVASTSYGGMYVSATQWQPQQERKPENLVFMKSILKIQMDILERNCMVRAAIMGGSATLFQWGFLATACFFHWMKPEFAISVGLVGMCAFAPMAVAVAYIFNKKIHQFSRQFLEVESSASVVDVSFPDRVRVCWRRGMHLIQSIF